MRLSPMKLFDGKDHPEYSAPCNGAIRNGMGKRRRIWLDAPARRVKRRLAI
jgi:hypothetical protein